VADQSEPAFIDRARRQGWTWQRIADVLGLPNAEAADTGAQSSVAELAWVLPSNLPQPWLGGGEHGCPFVMVLSYQPPVSEKSANQASRHGMDQHQVA
jgi:hypothetical protein